MILFCYPTAGGFVIDIDRSSPIPIYQQLKALILEQIETGLWRSGDRIPTEQEMCRWHNISRAPVRQALNELAREGVVNRHPGRGTFVNSRTSEGPAAEAPIRVMSSDPYWSQVLDHVSGAWNARHPSQEIGFEVQVVDHSRLYSLLCAAVGSGAAPDVAMVDSVWVAGLAQSRFLYALEDLGSQWNHTGFQQDLYPAFVEANSFSGRLYGLPAKADVSLLWYRKDWFAEEGLKPPHDWDALLEVARHFLQPQVQAQYGFTFPLVFPAGTAGGEATVYNLMPFVWSAGGAVFDVETNGVVLDAAPTRDALQFLRELVVLHHVSPPEVVGYGADTTPALFAGGRAAMALGGSYECHAIRRTSGWGEGEFNQRVGCVAPSVGPGGGPFSTVGGTSYVIMRQCQRPALVMDVLKQGIRPDVVGDLYRSMLQNSPCPSFYALIDPTGESMVAQVSRMIAAGRARPAIPEYVKVSNQLQAMFEAAIATSAPIGQIVERVAEFIGAIAGRPFWPV